MNHFELFALSAEQASRQPAISDDHETITYQQLLIRVERAALVLKSAGLKAEDRVLISDDRRIDTAVSVLACWKLGLIVCLRSNAMPNDSEQWLIGAIKPRGVITGADVVSTGFQAVEGIPSFSEVPVLLIPTAGSSGEPKVVAHSKASLLAGLMSTVALQEELIAGGSVQETDAARDIPARLLQAHLGLCFLSMAPLSTIAGVTVLQRALLTGEHLVISKDFEPSAVIELMRRRRVTNLGTSPLFARQLVRAYRQEARRLNSLLLIGIGGGPTPASVVRDVEEQFDCPVTVGYGSTEMGGPVLMTRPSQDLETRATTVGSPLPGIDCRIEPRDRSRELSNDEIGELILSGPSRMLGYWGGDSDGVIQDGWYRTGDLATSDEQGNYRIVGRVSGFIIRGGTRIDPTEIEDIIIRYADVEDAAIVGVDSRIPGEQDIIAFIVTSDRDSHLTRRVLRVCREHLPNIQVPRRVIPVDQLPVLRDGSVDRQQLLVAAHR